MLQRNFRVRTKSVDLKTTLLVRIVLVAAACIAAAASLSMLQTAREASARAQSIATVVGQQLDLQLLRISAGIDSEARFPDWDTVVTNLPVAGHCIELRGMRGDMVRNHCVGSSGPKDPAPHWFVAAWKNLFGGVGVVQRAVRQNGAQRGTVVVSSDDGAIAQGAWGQMLQLILLTGLIVAAMSAVVLASIGRALAPAAELIAGLEKMAAGSFQARLPAFRLNELERIGRGVNVLAAKIEATLGDRAELMRRLVTSQEDERRGLARELHDEYGQNLAAVAALAASIERSAEEADPGVAREARTIGSIAGEMMQALRGTLLRLRPAEVESFGLGEGLRQLVDRWNASQSSGTRFSLELPEQLAPLEASNAMHIYRIAQEAVTNAARHANARNVKVRVGCSGPEEPPSVCLTVEDDGSGPAPLQRGVAAGIGTLNMRERVAALGGTIAFDDVPSGGVRVRVVVPAAAPSPTGGGA